MGAGGDADVSIANKLSFDKLFLDTKRLNDIRFALNLARIKKKEGDIRFCTVVSIVKRNPY